MSKKNPSRADRLAEALDNVTSAISEIESLKEEMENWRDSVPENLQGGDKYAAIEEAIDNLESILNNLEEATSTDVEFPGMFG